MMIHTNTNAKVFTIPTRLILTLSMAVACNTSIGLAEDLPSSKEIIAKMIEGGGGASAMRKVQNRVVKMTMDFGMAGVIGKGLIHFSRPSNMHLAMDVAGMGSVEEGVSDGVAWALAMMTGPQIKEGDERAAALREANFDGLLDWKSQYKKIECVSKDTLDGKEYFKVEMTPLQGEVITSYVDTKTYLPYRTELTLSTAMGDFDVVVFNGDYRALNGVQYPYKSRFEVMGQTRVLTIDSIKHNVEMPKDQFKLPDEIAALVAKSESEKSKASEKIPGNDTP